MKKIYLLILIVCLSSFAFAQQNTFERVYDTLGFTTSNCVIETFDGCFVVVGSRYTSMNAQDVVVMKVDSLGKPIWVKIYGGPGNDEGKHVEQTPDSGFIVLGLKDFGPATSSNWLLRLDANGDTLWTQSLTLGTGSTYPYRLTNGFNSTYPSTGYYEKPASIVAVYLLKADSIGAAVMSKTYSDTMHQFGYDVKQTMDSGYIICGAKGNSDINAFIIKTNSTGDTLWSRTFGGPNNDQFLSVQQTTDSGYIVAGYKINSFLGFDVFLLKTNELGDTIWTALYGYPYNSGAYCVQKTIDGGYIVSARIVNGSPLSAKIWLLKIDQNGDTLWTKQFGCCLAAEGYFVQQTTDAGYIISGQVQGSFGVGIYLIKTDSIGRVLTNIAQHSDVENPGVLVYPNPNSGQFNIHLNGTQNSKISLFSIEDLTGRNICSGRLLNEYNLDLSVLSSGVYFLKIETEKKYFTHKLIIQH